ncbi:MAG: transketolase [Gammaproteobacteria bacterium]|jgi:transketolase
MRLIQLRIVPPHGPANQLPMMENFMPLRTDLANAIRALSMDAVQAANSGHPGMPMGMADIAEVVWNTHLRHNPGNPAWMNRDRFVLSNGHGSMLLYSLLHLSGYDLSIEDLRQFRQLGSKTPGHPEFRHAPGVETTTGPLGQGLANAVGMAIAERALAAEFNRDDCTIVDHHTYVFVGDGCLMEGISHEACSLAGTLGLGKLICIYDDNGISIDGDVQGWFTEDVPARFEAYGWHVVRRVDGHDASAIDAAINAAKADRSRPSLICARTVIGRGSPNKQGTAASHGAALGADEVALAREALGWPHAAFEIPEEIYSAWDACERGAQIEGDWDTAFDLYRKAHPKSARELLRRMRGALPEDFDSVARTAITRVSDESPNVATRKASEMALEALGPGMPELLGGSADLTGSNNTKWSGSKLIDANSPGGNYLNYGVREFAMSAIGSGIALHGGFIPYSGTFLVFSEYARNALRMAALMKIRNIFVYTHDSIGLGEDGPTHQAVEQAATLRLMPNMCVWRPCDAVETMAAWKSALQRADGPSCLLLSRQNLAAQSRTGAQLALIERGAYVLRDSEGEASAIIIATGSEVEIAAAACDALSAEGIAVRLVSMPCAEVFDAQPQDYRQTVLPDALTVRVSIEAGVTDYWYKYTGLTGLRLGVDTFGDSGPYKEVYAKFGLTPQGLADAVRGLLAR